ncbi:C2H2 zinc finger [Rhizoctonia solani]|uniref:C2H2 zinc finger n=1 Tax=Rhizoctonia solani TaxID=456999 RepID=A0A8H8SY13_9AGAM|nr:C2H2 zinc finger [Rhizoctonia solani]QRW20878.1 C2H2 zinc finger [Rhizoctonia solani]
MTSVHTVPSSSRSLPPIPLRRSIEAGPRQGSTLTPMDIKPRCLSHPYDKACWNPPSLTNPTISDLLADYRVFSARAPAQPPFVSARQHRVDSISTVGTDDISRPPSPDALSSSTSSLSSILEDRSSCTSPGRSSSRFPRLPAHSAFELSDLRTSLPSEPGPSKTPVFRSPRSTPLPVSRPMSPAVQLSPHMRPLTQRLRGLTVAVRSHVLAL